MRWEKRRWVRTWGRSPVHEDSDDSEDDDIVIPGSPAQTPKKGGNMASKAAGSK